MWETRRLETLITLSQVNYKTHKGMGRTTLFSPTGLWQELEWFHFTLPKLWRQNDLDGSLHRMGGDKNTLLSRLETFGYEQDL